MTRITFSTVIGILLSATSGGMAASALSTATPDTINMTVQKAEISSDDLSFITIFDNPTPDPVPVTSSTHPILGQKDQIPVGTYRVLRLTVTEISWHASWGLANPSPCDGVTTSGEAIGTVDLGGHTDFYFKTPDLGGNTMAYYQSHPPLSGYVGDALHPFVLVSPAQVLKDTVTPVNLVIGATDTLSCDALSIYSRTAGVDAAALRTLGGPATTLNGAEGVYLDTVNNEIGMTNSGNNSVTVYDRNADGDVAPIRHPLIGPDTRLNGPAGIAVYVDSNNSDNDEIMVANTGNDSVTVYSRTASDNTAPLRSLTGTQTGLSRPKGIYLDAAANEILVANSGKNSVTIFNRKAYLNASPYRTIIGDLTGLSNPCGVYVDAVRGEIGVANTDTNSVTIYSRDDLNKSVGVSKGYADMTSTVRDPGALSGQTFTLDFSETAASPDITVNVFSTTTLSDLSDSINKLDSGNYEISPGNPRVKATIMNTGSTTTPYRLVITSNLVEPANNVTVGGTLLTEIPDFLSLGNVSPIRTISGPELSSPCGLYLDTTRTPNEIAVANSGNNTVAIYKRTDTGDYQFDPTRLINGLNGPRALYLDTTRDEIGVVHKGPSVVMAQQPSIFPSGSDGNASISALAGDYNVVFYGVDIKGTDGTGTLIPAVFMERGTATFDASTTDASATPWPTFILQLDTQLEGRISTPDCPTGADVGVLKSGFYSVNHDGSFYVFIPGIQGSLQGAFLPDGTTFVGAMVDNSKRMMLVYGVKTTGSFSPYLTSDGTISGGETHYAFARYRNSPLNYMLGIGMAATDASYFKSTSGDANFVRVTGQAGYSQDNFDLRLNAPQLYASYPGGFLNNPSEGLSGAATMDGAALIFARDTVTKDSNGCPGEIGFGMGLRQGPAGTFTTAGIKGTYFAAAFGDRYEINTGRRSHRSTAVRLDFDGAGSVEITAIENAGGMISMDKSSYTYQVHARRIPSLGDTSSTVDVVDIFDQQPTTGPYASALIGRDGMSLGFFRNLNPGDTPNRTRLLGLAVFQHS
jgi:hypothetical protein